MKTTDAFSDLRRLDRPVIETGEAAARLGLTSSRASRVLREMEGAGLVRKLRHGLWLIDTSIEPFALAPYLTAPYPAYVSFSTALRKHGMIEQIPRQIFVASLDRTGTVETPVANYSIHHLAPEVFGGYAGTAKSGYLATREKALFDSAYLPSANRLRAYLPELELPSGFDTEALFTWTDAISAGWLRTKVRRSLEQWIQEAETPGR